MRLDVWLAAMLLTPRRAAASMVVCIAVFCLLGLGIHVLSTRAETLFMDSTEAYAWGMQFLGGYGRHPPLTGWIARIWYSVFPAANWSSYALSEVMTGVSLVSIYLIGRRVLGLRRATLVVFAMMLYPLFFGAKADRFNNYQVLLAVMPLTIWLFLRAFEKPTARAGLALGLAAAAATLTIYSAAFGLTGIGLAALLHPRRGAILYQPRALCRRDRLSAGDLTPRPLARSQRFFVAALGVGLRQRSFPSRSRRDLSRAAFRASCLLPDRTGHRAVAVAVAVRP